MKKRTNTRDWRNLPVEKWNATTFREYLKYLHLEKFGIPYVPKNYAVEGRMLKRTWEEYGKLATKRFIEKCFEIYRPTPNYPGVNFGFMYSYMRGSVMPRVLKEIQIEKTEEQYEQQEIMFTNFDFSRYFR